MNFKRIAAIVSGVLLIAIPFITISARMASLSGWRLVLEAWAVTILGAVFLGVGTYLCVRVGAFSGQSISR